MIGVSRFFRAREGAVGMMFALSAVPLLGLAGIAADYANATRARAQLNSIADAAAVSSVSETILKPTMTRTEQRDAAVRTAQAEFAAQIAAQPRNWALASSSITAEEVGSAVRIKVCYEANQPATMSQLFGQPTIAFANCAQAESAPPTFVSVYALVDASGSMGIGSTKADQELMQRQMGCVFACHTTGTTAYAKQIGAVTRFDVIVNALKRVAQQAQALTRVSGQYKLTIHKFSNYVTEVVPTTTNMTTASNSLQSMQMDQRGAGTNFYAVLADFARVLPQSGDGKTSTSPKIFVLILTDGIGSDVFEERSCYWGFQHPCAYQGWWYRDPRFVIEEPGLWWGVRTQAINPSGCQAIKAKGATIMTLETEFDSSGSTDAHMKEVDMRFRSVAKTNLATCATATNLAYSANLGPDVDRAISQMFTSVVEKARLVR
ncbi:Putative Flp pilus-assembly TadG-like, N-terminal [Rhabdaerophilaceae bacterium]